MPLPETITLLELKRWAASCGPSEKKRPPIDHDESTARAARKNGRRTTAGTLALGPEAEAAAFLDRLRHPVGAGKGDREEDEQHDVGQDAGQSPELDERR